MTPGAGGPEGSVVRRFPERIVVCDLERQLTYAELAAEAAKVARAIAALDAPAGPVALASPLEAGLVAGFFGTMAGGRIVVPLDPEHPAERNRRIAEHAGAAARSPPRSLRTRSAPPPVDVLLQPQPG